MSEEVNPRIREMLENLQNEGYHSFAFEWHGTRVPQNVTFPDGAQKDVQYMRDGILLFTDGSSATYDRLVDDPKVEKQKIQITVSDLGDRKSNL